MTSDLVPSDIVVALYLESDIAMFFRSFAPTFIPL